MLLLRQFLRDQLGLLEDRLGGEHLHVGRVAVLAQYALHDDLELVLTPGWPAPPNPPGRISQLLSLRYKNIDQFKTCREGIAFCDTMSSINLYGRNLRPYKLKNYPHTFL